MNAVGYIRVSTDEQAGRGHSLDAQTTLIREFVAARGWHLRRIYADEGLSGSRDDRPALRQLLREAEAGHFDVVVVHAVDRLYRNLEALLSAFRFFQERRIAFVSLTENLDFTTPWGKLTLAVLGTLAEIYLDRLRAETSKGLHQRARKGLHNGSIPLGYCKGLCSRCADPNGPGYCPLLGLPDRGDGQTLVLHPVERVAVRLAFEWAATGQYSDGQIARQLNATRYRPPGGQSLPLRTKRHPARGGPGPFSKDSVRDILTRPFYTGVVPYYGTDEQGRKRKRGNPVALYPGRHPPLIPQALFERVQEVRRLLSRNPRRRGQTPARIYPLSGLLRCDHCRARMRAQTGARGRRYYVCATRLQHSGDCRQPAIPADRLETQLAAFLKHIRIPADWQHRALRQLGRDPAEQARQEAALRARLERATELYLQGVLSRARFEAEKRLCEKGIADLQIREISVMIIAESQLQTLQTQWEQLSDFEKKRLLRGLFAAVYARGHALVAAQLTEAVYPLLKTMLPQEEDSFYSGSDGT